MASYSLWLTTAVQTFRGAQPAPFHQLPSLALSDLDASEGHPDFSWSKPDEAVFLQFDASKLFRSYNLSEPAPLGMAGVVFTLVRRCARMATAHGLGRVHPQTVTCRRCDALVSSCRNHEYPVTSRPLCL